MVVLWYLWPYTRRYMLLYLYTEGQLFLVGLRTHKSYFLVQDVYVEFPCTVDTVATSYCTSIVGLLSSWYLCEFSIYIPVRYMHWSAIYIPVRYIYWFSIFACSVCLEVYISSLCYTILVILDNYINPKRNLLKSIYGEYMGKGMSNNMGKYDVTSPL